jgi:hypothetical protein
MCVYEYVPWKLEGRKDKEEGGGAGARDERLKEGGKGGTGSEAKFGEWDLDLDGKVGPCGSGKKRVSEPASLAPAFLFEYL